MSSKSNAELTRRIVGSRLWLVWIWICSGIVCLADLAGIITLAVEGVQGALYVLPIVFLAIDVVITLLSVFLNFRFRRALAVPIIYAVVKVLVVFAAIGTFFGDYIMFSTAAAVLWLLFEVVSIVCVLVSAVYAKGSGKSFTVVVAIFTAVIVILCGVYTYFVATNGFFGQSKDRTYEKRTLVYSFYDEREDSLVVSGVLDGSGDTVVIPESFNGMPVVGVDCRVFIYEGVDTIVLQCAEGTEFSNVENLCFFDDDVSVYVESDNVNYFRNYFFALAEEYSSSGISTFSTADGYAETLSVNIEGKTPKPLGEALAGFANMMSPVVDDDQIFVSISIDYEYVAAIGGKIPDVWIGEKGESFDFHEVYGFDYLDHMDEGSEDDLYWCYENLGKYILLDVVDSDGKSALGRAIGTSSVLSYEMSRVYAVEIGESNDAAHTELDADTGFVLTAGFCPEGSSSGLGRRYVTENTADKIFALIGDRTGFTLSWKAGEAASSEKDITTFKGNIYDGMTVSPYWTMEDPVISKIYTNKDGNEVVYGNSVTFSVVASFADSGILLSYEWEYAGTQQSDMSSFTLENMLPSQSGTYRVTVTAGGDENTSLTTSVNESLYLTVGTRDVTLTWETSTDLVYSGTEVTVTVTPNAGTNDGTSGTVNGDSLTFDMVKTGTIKDVGNYTVTVSLAGTWGELYNITNYSNDYTVTAYPLTVVWDKTQTFTYNGAEQHPDYFYTGRNGEEKMTALGGDTLSTALNVKVSYGGGDEGIDAGTHTVSLSTENKNYSLQSSSYTYSIAKQSVYVTWVSESEFVYTYDSSYQYPTVEASGLIEGDKRTNDNTASVGLIYSDYGKDAGTYTVKVSVNSNNYELVNGTDTYTATSYTYTINQKPVTITWQYSEDEPFVYEATNYTIEAAINGIEESDLSDVYLSYWDTSDYKTFSYGVNAGTYDIYATLSGERAGNYLLTDNHTTYEITPKSLTIKPETLNKMYDSYAYADKETYWYSDLAKGDYVDYLEEIVSIGVVYMSEGKECDEARDARDYTFTLTIKAYTGDGSKFNNYSIVGYSDTDGLILTGTITINPVTLSLNWNYTKLTYNSKSQQIDASVSGFVGGDISNSTVTSHVSDLFYTITAQSGSGNNPVDAGTYGITAALQSDVINYVLDPDEASTEFTIAKYTVYVNWGNNTLTYEAKAIIPEYSYQITTSVTKEAFETVMGATVYGYETNVGENYTAEIEITNSNYTISNDTYGFKIIPVELKITWKLSESDTSGTDVLTYTYSAAKQGPVADIISGQMKGSDQVILTFTYNGTDFAGNAYDASSVCPMNAGYYYVLAAVDNNANYIVDVDYQTRSFVIDKATLIVNWDSNTNPFTYNGDSQQIQAHVTPLGSDELELVYTVTNSNGVPDTEHKNADKYDISVALKDSVTNYELGGETSSSFTINPLEITVDWGDAVLTYNGESQVPSHTYSVPTGSTSETVTDDLLGASVTGAIREVGYSTAVLTKTNDNYTLMTDTETCSFSIVVAEITITWDVEKNYEYTYKAEGKSPSARINDDQIFGNDKVEIKYTYKKSDESSESSDKPVNVGTYTVTATLSNSNYVIKADAAWNFSITAATLEVTWDNDELTYNGKSQQIYAHVEPFGTDTLTLVYTITSSTGASEHINADTYSISVALEDSVKNYVIDGDTTNSFTINPFGVTVEWDTAELTYDGNDNRHPTATISENQIFGNDSVTVSEYGYTDSYTSHKDVGTYSVKAVSLNNSNYVIIDKENATKEFTIIPESITITWDVENNHEYTYTSEGISPSAKIDANQIYGNDEVKIEYTYKKSSESSGSSDKPVDVGTYTVTATLTNSNYEIKANATWTFSIVPAEITITWDATDGAQYTYNSNRISPSAVISGQIYSNDEVKIVYTYTGTGNSSDKPVNAGTYTVTASSGNPNYELSGGNLTISFTINKATLRLKWPSTTSYEYNGSPIEPTAEFATDGGPYDGDEVKLQYTYDDEHTNVGNHTVSVSLEDSNYEIDSSMTTFSYTIIAKTVKVEEISWNETKFTYNGNAQSPEATVTLSEDVGYTIGYSYSKADGTTLGGAPTDAGSYTVTVTITLSSLNYSLDTSGVTLSTDFTIEKATLEVEWTGGESFSEGDDTMHPVATVIGWAEGNEVTVKYTYASTSGGSYSETEPSSEGSYTVKIELTYDENNYVVATGNEYEKSYKITAASNNNGV